MEKTMIVDQFAEAKRNMTSRMDAASGVIDTAIRMRDEAVDNFVDFFRKLIISCSPSEFEVLLCSPELSNVDREFAFEERMKFLMQPAPGDEPCKKENEPACEREAESGEAKCECEEREVIDPMEVPAFRFLHDLCEALSGK